jgi:general secretion pathway protein G
MIELIFVIVIIGILAAVAIPKLAATRDDAAATTCVHEIGQFMGEVTATYTKVGATNFETRGLSRMTNTPTAVTTGNNGFTNAADDAFGDGAFEYQCGEASPVVTFEYTAAANGNPATIVVTPDTDSEYDPTDGTTDPATIGQIVVSKLAGGILEANGDPKTYKL